MAMRCVLLHMFFLLSLAVAQTLNSTTTTNNTKPDCQSSCGNVDIPYPFGIGPNCSMNSDFNITCNTSFNPPKPFVNVMSFGEVLNIEVVNISKSQIYVKNSKIQLANKCDGTWSNNNTRNYIIRLDLFDTPYILSDANKLTAVGCDDLALLLQLSNNLSGIGCLPYCPDYPSDSVGTCPGMGCCQTSISKSVYLYVNLDDMHTNWGKESKEHRCSFAFIGMIDDIGNFTFNLSDLNDPKAFLKNNKKFIDKPLVLDWRIGPDSNCTKTSCGKNSRCTNYWDSLYGGYECRCNEGYEGNPYLGL